jgi:hypothetical protein
MKTHITRLIEHMIWADNIHWSMFNSDEKYLQDKQLFEKLVPYSLRPVCISIIL